MKKRSGFVTNSSSSSFLIRRDLQPIIDLFESYIEQGSFEEKIERKNRQIAFLKENFGSDHFPPVLTGKEDIFRCIQFLCQSELEYINAKITAWLLEKGLIKKAISPCVLYAILEKCNDAIFEKRNVFEKCDETDLYIRIEISHLLGSAKEYLEFNSYSSYEEHETGSNPFNFKFANHHDIEDIARCRDEICEAIGWYSDKKGRNGDNSIAKDLYCKALGIQDKRLLEAIIDKLSHFDNHRWEQMSSFRKIPEMLYQLIINCDSQNDGNCKICFDIWQDWIWRTRREPEEEIHEEEIRNLSEKELDALHVIYKKGLISLEIIQKLVLCLGDFGIYTSHAYYDEALFMELHEISAFSNDHMG